MYHIVKYRVTLEPYLHPLNPIFYTFFYKPNASETEQPPAPPAAFVFITVILKY